MRTLIDTEYVDLDLKLNLDLILSLVWKILLHILNGYTSKLQNKICTLYI